MAANKTLQACFGDKGYQGMRRTSASKNDMRLPNTEATAQDTQGSSRPAAAMIPVGTFSLLHDIDNNAFVLNRVGVHNIQPLNSAQTTCAPDMPSAKHAERLDAYFDRFFPNVATVSILGSSITFALIESQLQDPLSGVASKKIFDLSTVRILIATSWVLFTMTLIFSFLLAGVLKWWRSRPSSSANDGFWVLGILYVLMGDAFVCLSLAVAAYVEVVGFIAVGIIGLISLPLVIFVVALFWNGAELVRLLDHTFLTAGPLREDR